MKCQRMVCVNKTSGDYEIYRHNPDILLGFYMAAVLEYECHVVAANRRKKDEW